MKLMICVTFLTYVTLTSLVVPMVYSVPMTLPPLTRPMVTVSPVKPIHCNFELNMDIEDLLKIWIKCAEQTGFQKNKTTQTGSQFVDAIINLKAIDFEDKCWGKCIVDKMQMFKADGSLKTEDFGKILKSNARADIEISRIHGWQSCAARIGKDAKSAGGIKSSCKFPIKFFACGIQMEEDIYKNCH